MQEILRALSLPGVWNELVQLIRNPNSNIVASLLLLSAIVIVVLLVASTVIALVSGSSRRHRQADREELETLLAVLDALDQVDVKSVEGEQVEGWEKAPEVLLPVHRVVHLERPPLSQRLLVGAASAIAIVIVLVIAIGVSSSSSAACAGCHQTTPHTEVVSAGMNDPHEGVSCVRCHESSGPIGIVTVESFDRVAHFFSGLGDQGKSSSYGSVRTSACNACHRDAIRTVTEDEVRGILMSHVEPLEAGAECLDCHTGRTGVISTVTNGMTPCLRCHDGESQPTECSTCHTKEVSAATTPTSSASMKGRALITTPDCGGCHEQETQCDPCHAGIRMPHSELFMWWGHARKGVEDTWYNGGKACGRCHTDTRRPCTSCHTFMPGHPTDPWAKSHGVVGRANAKACDSCHGNKAYVNNRDFCLLCHGEQVTQ